MTDDGTNHMNILIGREMRERIEETPENLIGRALNIAEYIVMHGAPNTSDEEMQAAKTILETRGSSYLLEISPEDFPRYAIMIREKAGPQHAFCIKCGRALKNKNALKVGMGISCKAQIKAGNWIIDRGNKTSTDDRRQDVIENDSLEMNDENRLGLRRLAIKYGVSVSTIRIDRQLNKRGEKIKEMIDNLVELGDMPVEADFYPRIDEPLIPPPPEPKKAKKEEKDPNTPEGKMEGMNVKAAVAFIKTLEDEEDLNTYRDAEVAGKNRKSVIKAFDAIINADPGAEPSEDPAIESGEKSTEPTEDPEEE